MSYLRIMQIEWQKLKRSGIMYIVWGAPLFVVMLQFLNFKLRYDILIPSGSSPWWVFIQEIGSFWGALVLPILAAIIAAIICGQEHSTNVWKYIIALPIKRWQIYTGKLLMTLFLLTIASVILICGMIISGLVLGFNELVPLQEIWWLFIFPLLGVIALTSIQMWLSTRFHNLSIPIGVGILCIVVSLFVAQSSITFWFPWAYPFMTAPIGTPYEPYFYSGLSIIVGLLCTLIGIREFSRRDI